MPLRALLAGMEGRLEKAIELGVERGLKRHRETYEEANRLEHEALAFRIASLEEWKARELGIAWDPEITPPPRLRYNEARKGRFTMDETKSTPDAIPVPLSGHARGSGRSTPKDPAAPPKNKGTLTVTQDEPKKEVNADGR